MMENKIVNWGVISCAGIADSAVIPGIKAAGNAKLYAISSRSKEKLEEYSQKHKPVKAYQSYNDYLTTPTLTQSIYRCLIHYIVSGFSKRLKRKNISFVKSL